MPSLWFVMPAHGRAELARICMRQLARTCAALTAEGVEATAVVVTDDENLETAERVGFGTVRRDNQFLSAKFDDGIQLALDPEFNPRPAEYVCMLGSDDWIDHRLLLTLPSPDRVLGFRRLSFVKEDGLEITAARVGYRGGCGMRVYHRDLMAVCDFRPAGWIEDRTRACDTAILNNVRAAYEAKTGRDLLIAEPDTDPRAIVDWKNPAEQINSYDDITGVWRGESRPDPFAVLAGVFPPEALAEMEAFYAGVRENQLVAA